MAVSQNQRLRKAAAKAAKRKAVVAVKLERERRELSISKPRHIDLAGSPIVACKMTEDFESRGMGTLFIARKLTLGRFAACFFLLDTWCLGVKDVFFRILDADDFEFYQEHADDGAPSAPMDPASARKLIGDAAAYGLSNGVAQPDDLGEMLRMFGDIAPSGPTFAFGDDGKPHFVAGPHDSMGRVRRTLQHLERTLGANGFYFTLPLEETDEEDFEEGDGEGDDEGPILEGELGEDQPIPEHALRGAPKEGH